MPTRQLKAEGIKARVVSMPSWEFFEKQDELQGTGSAAGRDGAVSVEMASTFGWERYVGPKGKMIGMHRFGASAPLKDLQKKFGFTPENVVAAARKAIGQVSSRQSSSLQSSAKPIRFVLMTPVSD